MKAKMMDVTVPPTPDPDEAAKTIQCKVEGDKATCTAEGMEEPLKLVRKGGKWLVVPDVLHGGRATGSHCVAPPPAHCNLGADLRRRPASGSVLAVTPTSIGTV